MTRRQALKSLCLATFTVATAPGVSGQTTHWEYKGLKEGSHPFKLPPLPYAFDGLEPYLDASTVEIHHGYDYDAEFTDKARHLAGPSKTEIYQDGVHALYVKNLNKTIGQDRIFYLSWASTGRLAGSTNTTDKWLESMLRNLNSVPEKIRPAIRNNGGGHYNHSLFWQMMKKNGGGEPKQELAKSIEKNFGSFPSFKEKFLNAAKTLFGSGWAWLTLDGAELKIETTPNEDTPLSTGREVLLGIDLWEHAYYLKYQNNRADYIAAWFNVIDWDFVTERYIKVKGGQ